jgi:hypothetical protein
MAPCPGGRACLDRAGQGGGPLRLPQPWLGWVGRWCIAQVHLSATWTDHHQSAAARSGPGHSTRAAHDGGALWSAAWQAGGGFHFWHAWPQALSSSTIGEPCVPAAAAGGLQGMAPPQSLNSAQHGEHCGLAASQGSHQAGGR